MTNLESLVPILEVCQQLQAAGFPQDTALQWSMQHEPHIPDVEPAWMSMAFDEPILCAAPTAEEILKELPSICLRRIAASTANTIEVSLALAAARAWLWWKECEP